MADLRVSNLVKSFGATPVLKNVSLSVDSGDLVAVLGASGSGKTTLLRLIAGFDRPDRGEISLDGETVAGGTIFKRPEQRGIGYVAQEGALFPHLSVADNITFGLSRAQRKMQFRVDELLTMVGLKAEYACRAPHQLSGGEQQRVALARALAPAPRLVLLDEPFSALDAGLRIETREAVARAIRMAGATAILVTHDQSEALSMGRLVGVLQQGVLAQMSAPEDLYRYPVNPALADFVGEAVFAPGLAGGGQVSCALGMLDLVERVDGPVQAMIRPEQIKLLPQATPGTVPARVKSLAFYGHDAMVTLDVLAAAGGAPITARVLGHTVPKPGSAVWLEVEGPVVAYPAPALAAE